MTTLLAANWDHWCSSLAGVLWRASWQGTLLILVVFAICRLGRRLPPAFRSFLWWLTCAKMLVSLCGLITIPLAVLPSSPPPVARALVTPSYLLVRIAHAHRTPVLTAKAAPAKVAAVTPSQQSMPSPVAPATTRKPLIHFLPAFIAGLWGVGVALLALLTLRAAGRSRREVQGATPIAGDDLVEAGLVAEWVGLRRLPRIVRSDTAQSVFVAGLFSPAIVLPGAGMLSPDELRMALAHEMAHLRRHDLWSGVAPVLARILFFFHPLVWLAFHEYSNAREEACDLLALRATGFTAAGYGRLLIKMAQSQPSPATAGALPLSPAYRALRRRLATIALGNTPAPGPIAWLFLVPVLFALCVLVAPLRLVAKNDPRIGALLAPGAPEFLLRDLGLAGPGEIGSVAMSESGQVAATAQTSDGNISHAFVLTSQSETSLGSLPRYAYCRANAINDIGSVAASSYNLIDRNHAFIWTPDGNARLAGLPGYRFSKALAINDLDQVAGYVETGRYIHGELVSRAAIWVADPGLPNSNPAAPDVDRERALDLGTLGGPNSAALAINNSGLVVGKSDTSTPQQTHAFVWRNGRMIDLGALPGGVNSMATAINDSGEVVGDSETYGAPRAFAWQNGQLTDLGMLKDAISSHAGAINNAGEIVGQCVLPVNGAPQAHAVLWKNGRIYDLNNLVHAPGWVLEGACAITSSGQIAGIGYYRGKARVFVLTPASTIPGLQYSMESV